MNKAYSRIIWQNYPSANTPLNEANLNLMDVGINELDNRIVVLDSLKLDKNIANSLVKEITLDETTGILKINKLSGETINIDTKLEKIAINFEYDAATQNIVITLDDGTKQYIDISSLVSVTEFDNSSTIIFEIKDSNHVSAKIADGSITENMLSLDYKASITVHVQEQTAISTATIVSEKNTAIQEIEAKKTEVLNSIPADYQSTIARVDTLETEMDTAQTNITALQGFQTTTETKLENVDEELTQLKEETSRNYSDTFFQNYFALRRTGKKYTVRIPLWETSHVATIEKLDDNAGLVCEPSTKTVKGRDDYENIDLFKTYDVNAEIKNGKVQVTAFKGDDNYDPYEKDVFVLGMPYFQKVWVEDGYTYISRSDTKHEGYILCKEAEATKGFCLYAKYQAGYNSSNVLGSFKGVKPKRNMSYDNNVTESGKRGDGYAFGMACDMQYLQITYLLMLGDRNSNNKVGGCFNYNLQYNVSVAEENTTRVILQNANANNIAIGSSVSVGELGENANKDRGQAYVHNICDSALVKDIVVVDENNKALILDVDTPFTTTLTTLVTTMHWQSGFSDDMQGRTGCYCEATSQISSIKYPSVINGIECCVGGYEVLGNAVMSITESGYRDCYFTNDSKKLTTNTNNIVATYDKTTNQWHASTLDVWSYITEIDFDIANGVTVNTDSGQSGSGTSTGYCDGQYFDSAASGFREVLCFGYLGHWSHSGLFCVGGSSGLSTAGWYFLARLSVNGFRGELSA